MKPKVEFDLFIIDGDWAVQLLPGLMFGHLRPINVAKEEYFIRFEFLLWSITIKLS